MHSKEEIKELRMKFKQGVHQCAPVDAFRDAAAVVDGLEGLELPAEEALSQAGKWLLAHTKGPSVEEWKELLRFQLELISVRQPTPGQTRTAFYATYFLIIGIKKWRKHLNKIPHLYDTVIGATIPVLSLARDLPVKARLLLIRAVEEVLGGLDKSPTGRYRLAELRMHRGILMGGSSDPNDVDLALRLLRQQALVFAKLDPKQFEEANTLHLRTLDNIERLQTSLS